MDIATYCVENPGASNVNGSNLENCANATAPDGKTITVTAPTFSCDDDGTIKADKDVTAEHADVSEYQAKCTIKDSGIKCTVEEQ